MTDHECFVIMPFGTKNDANGDTIDFDKIYQYLIKPALDELGIRCTRSDEIDEAGWIHSRMFQQIYTSRVAVVDITSLNPNVFYELGVRHALADSVTVIIRRTGTKLPFNIQDLKIIEYDDRDMGKVDEAKRKIRDFIRNGLNSRTKPDSPVHDALKLRINREAVKLDMRDIFEFKLKHVPGKHICLVTGDIQNIQNLADIWVSSENTNMQMSRYYEKSVSGVIRFLGAKRDKAKRVVDDIISKALTDAVGENAYVTPGEVVATTPGELGRSHGVKLVLHAAAVYGQVATGYTPIADVGKCVSNALHAADDQEHAGLDLKSILFPLMGTGTGRGSLEETVPKLIKAAIAYLDANPGSRMEKVFFVVWSDRELEVCQAVLQEAPELEKA